MSEIKEVFELTITADSVTSTDKRFSINNLREGDKFKALEAYFFPSDENKDERICRNFRKGERRHSNQVLPRLAFQIFEKHIIGLREEEKANFPIFKYSLNDSEPSKKGIFISTSYLLSIILIDGEMYSYDLFREYFIDNVLMNKFASALIWDLYDKEKNIITTFRYLEDGKYIDSEDKEIKIDDDSFVGLASPVEMSDETIDKWIKQLERYKLSQPLEQLKVVKLDKNNLQKEIKKFSSIEGTYGAFRDFAKRYEMHTNDKFGETITYTFTSNDDDIFSMSADIDEDTEYDDIIKINISFGNKNYKQISSRFIYSFLVFIICGFKLRDFL